MRYVATINTPGYLPDTDMPPPTFDTAKEAWEYLATERERAEDEAEYPDGSPLEFEYSDDVMVLHYLGREEHEPGNPHEDVCIDPDGTGSYAAATPGREEDEHDLGLVYSVTLVEEAEVDPDDPSRLRLVEASLLVEQPDPSVGVHPVSKVFNIPQGQQVQIRFLDEEAPVMPYLPPVTEPNPLLARLIFDKDSKPVVETATPADPQDLGFLKFDLLGPKAMTEQARTAYRERIAEEFSRTQQPGFFVALGEATEMAKGDGFERFLDPGRTGDEHLPDLAITDEQRQGMHDYMKGRWGDGRDD